MGVKRVVKRRPVAAQVAVEVEDEDVEDDVVEEVAVKVAPTPVARTPRVVPPAPQPVKREPVARRNAAPVAKVVVDDQAVDNTPIETEVVVNNSLGAVVDEIVKRLNVGQHVGLVRLSEGSVSVFFMNEDVSKLSAPVKKRPGVVGTKFDQITQTDEYKEHQVKWAAMSLAEKQAYAKKVKAVWEVSADERVNNMKMSVAVMAALGIQKYKPEYQTQAARNALRDGSALPESDAS